MAVAGIVAFVLSLALGLVSPAVTASAGPEDRDRPAPKTSSGQSSSGGPRTTPLSPPSSSLQARGPASVTATASSPYATPGLAIPAWGDAQWKHPDTFQTIELADLDGDGRDEIYGRLPAGLEVYDFRVDSGQWAPTYVTGTVPFADAPRAPVGWLPPYYYATIQAADVDGDGSEEVVGRGPVGLQIHSFEPAATAGESTWCTLSAQGPFTDWGPWAQDAAYYSTIQAADLDGDGRENEFFGRGTDGIEAWRFTAGDDCSTAGSSWTKLPTLPHFDDTTAGPGVADRYATIQAADLDGDGTDDVFGRASNGIYSYSLASGTWADLPVLKEFTDVQGFTATSQYGTIQTGDLDGEGGVEVFGRNADGIVGYRLESGTWQALKALTKDFGNSSSVDWGNAPGYYSTIQAADIDGDARDEVVGRSVDGIHAWELLASDQWHEVSTGGPFTDADGWSQDWSRFSTIQLGDIDGTVPLNAPTTNGSDRAEIIGRGPTGIQTYAWDDVKNTWVSPSATFPDYSTGTAKAAYQAVNATIATQLGYTNPDFDLRSTYGSETNYNLGTKYPELVAAATQPSNVPDAVWEAVTTQLTNELSAAASVEAYFAGVQGALQQDEITDLAQDGPQIAEQLDYNIKSSHALEADLFGLAAGVAEALANLATTETGVPVGSVVGGLFSAGWATGTRVSEGSGNSTLHKELRKILDDSAGMITAAADAIPAAREAVATDYGMLWEVGALTGNDTWVPPTNDSTAARTAQAFNVWVWQVVLNDQAHVEHKDKANAAWSYDGFHYGLKVGDASDIESQLFGKTSAGCLANFDPSCNLHVPPDFVFQGIYGWDIPCGFFTTCQPTGAWLPPE
ncbi:VCBS repeat-containing protein [Isoptericola sediminis]|uniref:VCBS repeat-containing protein n=1 Tax=Isoptericola sediminis TaxID=2733572 RepID=A0A849JUF4_9MICO|nr:VCBS repeat-containing protein [Isoptericola sediminis]NNU26214.1 VCBS repeat-containing protein [Isoptericola sediminis]